MKWYYKAVDYPLEYQFQAYAPGSSKEFPEEVLANVWNWDEQWKVEWIENGTCMGEMTRCEGLDPAAVEAFPIVKDGSTLGECFPYQSFV